MKGLTEKQAKLLAFIEGYIDKHSFSPSYREIMRHFNYASVASVYKHIQALKRKEALVVEKNCSRSIKPSSIKLKEEKEDLIVELAIIGYISKRYPIETFQIPSFLAVDKHFLQNEEKSYILQVRDDSLEGSQIYEGDFLVVESTEQTEAGDLVIARLRNEENVIKRYYPEGFYSRLESIHGSEHPLIIRHDEIEVLCKLLTLIRNFS